MDSDRRYYLAHTTNKAPSLRRLAVAARIIFAGEAEAQEMMRPRRHWAARVIHMAQDRDTGATSFE